MEESGELEARRRRQHLRWMWSYVEERLVRMARDIGHHHNIDNLENMVSHFILQVEVREFGGKHDQTEGTIMVLLWCPRSPLFTTKGGHNVGSGERGDQCLSEYPGVNISMLNIGNRNSSHFIKIYTNS